ncbi:MAG: hypothetical protein IH618_12275 [Ignavibacteriaceae bacterium]|nr:hypothetical protein [Ignavibacteriaceae bacterium]
MKKILIITAIIIASINGTALGQFGYHEHDGFFLRMLYGFGYAELVEKDVLGSDMKFSGLAQNLRFQIGATVAENLMLYGEFGGVMQFDPEFEWMGQSGTAEDVTVSVFDFGGGITYYLMPSNFYFSLSLLASQAEFEFNGTKGESQYGVGINGMFGKEWWVDAQWALGAAIYGYYSTMKDKGGDENEINNFSVGLLFSVTYN